MPQINPTQMDAVHNAILKNFLQDIVAPGVLFKNVAYQTVVAEEIITFTLTNNIVTRKCSSQKNQGQLRHDVINKDIFAKGTASVFEITGTLALINDALIYKIKAIGKTRLAKITQFDINNQSKLTALTNEQMYTQRAGQMHMKEVVFTNSRMIDNTIIKDTTSAIMIMRKKRGRELFDILVDLSDGKIFLSNLQRMNLTQKLLLALKEQVHDKDLFHGDIKPENILVYIEDNKIKEVTILDFGFSRDKYDNNNFTSGTPMYIPPEVRAFSCTYQQSDLYSLSRVIGLVWNAHPPVVTYKPLKIYSYAFKKIFEDIVDLDILLKNDLLDILWSFHNEEWQKRMSLEEAIAIIQKRTINPTALNDEDKALLQQCLQANPDGAWFSTAARFLGTLPCGKFVAFNLTHALAMRLGESEKNNDKRRYEVRGAEISKGTCFTTYDILGTISCDEDLIYKTTKSRVLKVAEPHVKSHAIIKSLMQNEYHYLTINESLKVKKPQYVFFQGSLEHRRNDRHILFLVREKAIGRDLLSILSEDIDESFSSLDHEQRKLLSLSVLVALKEQVHDHNITHCDLKPENIIINVIGSTYSATIIGYEEARNSEQTELGYCSNHSYTAPESSYTQGKNYQASDVYSIARILGNIWHAKQAENVSKDEGVDTTYDFDNIFANIEDINEQEKTEILNVLRQMHHENWEERMPLAEAIAYFTSISPKPTSRFQVVTSDSELDIDLDSESAQKNQLPLLIINQSHEIDAQTSPSQCTSERSYSSAYSNITFTPNTRNAQSSQSRTPLSFFSRLTMNNTPDQALLSPQALSPSHM